MGKATDRTLLSGWGRTSPTAAHVLSPSSPEQLRDDLRIAAPRAIKFGMIARGLGRSYGDAAQCGGGTVVDMTRLEGEYSEDLSNGRITVASGTSIDSLIRTFVPRGWFVPVTPGTRYITVGGAIAADVHGKNHHQDGSFGNHVRSLRLLSPSGVVTAGPEIDNPEIYWATVGGMGLTGIIEQAEISMIPIETSAMLVDSRRVANLAELIKVMNESDSQYRYSVAWIDCLASGDSLGRAVLTQGQHATAADLAEYSKRGHRGMSSRNPLEFHSKPLFGIPDKIPSGFLNRSTVRAFNEMWYRKAPHSTKRSLESISSFFHPLDSIRDWNRLYGRRGFIQYQMVLPFGREAELRLAIEMLSSSGCASFLAVLKRFGAASRAPISFPIPGWTLALDIPVGPPKVASLLDDLDELVAGSGGRVYFAKDSRLRPELVDVMYPRIDEWRQVRDRLDPRGLIASDLSRRLFLT